MKEENIRDIVNNGLDGLLWCNRVWEAWSVGTMGPDDFSEVSDTDISEDLIGSIMDHFQASPEGKLLALIALKFKSGNEIDVERITITRRELQELGYE